MATFNFLAHGVLLFANIASAATAFSSALNTVTVPSTFIQVPPAESLALSSSISVVTPSGSGIPTYIVVPGTSFTSVTPVTEASRSNVMTIQTSTPATNNIIEVPTSAANATTSLTITTSNSSEEHHHSTVVVTTTQSKTTASASASKSSLPSSGAAGIKMGAALLVAAVVMGVYRA